MLYPVELHLHIYNLFMYWWSCQPPFAGSIKVLPTKQKTLDNRLMVPEVEVEVEPTTGGLKNHRSDRIWATQAYYTLYKESLL